MGTGLSPLMLQGLPLHRHRSLDLCFVITANLFKGDFFLDILRPLTIYLTAPSIAFRVGQQHYGAVVRNQRRRPVMCNQRLSKLQHAADLCSSLVTALQDIGPSRCSRRLTANEMEEKRLEDKLERHLLTISCPRNEVIPPISRLPGDVLCCIFRIPFIEDRTDISTFRLLISSVSNRWRRIALHTPSLWTRVLLGLKYVGRHARRRGAFASGTDYQLPFYSIG